MKIMMSQRLKPNLSNGTNELEYRNGRRWSLREPSRCYSYDESGQKYRPALDERTRVEPLN